MDIFGGVGEVWLSFKKVRLSLTFFLINRTFLVRCWLVTLFRWFLFL